MKPMLNELLDQLQAAVGVAKDYDKTKRARAAIYAQFQEIEAERDHWRRISRRNSDRLDEVKVERNLLRRALFDCTYSTPEAAERAKNALEATGEGDDGPTN